MVDIQKYCYTFHAGETSQQVELYSSSITTRDQNQYVSEMHTEIDGSRNSTLKSRGAKEEGPEILVL